MIVLYLFYITCMLWVLIVLNEELQLNKPVLHIIIVTNYCHYCLMSLSSVTVLSSHATED